MSDEIARYHEVRPDGRRDFYLYADKILVRTRSSRVHAEITVKLADIRNEPNKLWVRPKGFGLSLVLFLSSFVFLIVGDAVRRRPDHTEDGLILWFSMAGGLAFIGLVIFSKTFKRIEFASFVSHAGIPALDVARSGHDREQFENFIDILIRQIDQGEGNKSGTTHTTITPDL